MTSLPANLPHSVEELIEELDSLNPAPAVTGPIQQEDIQDLVFRAGRRSVVDELLRLLQFSKEEVLHGSRQP